MTYSWSLSFWVRLIAGFVALSQATSQVLMMQDSTAQFMMDPANPFGNRSQTYMALIVGTGVSGSLFGAFSEPVGLLIINLWGAYAIYTWAVVSAEQFLPMIATPTELTDPFNSLVGVGSGEYWDVANIVAWIVCILVFFSFAVVRWPRWLISLLAGTTGACAGAHVTVQAIYFYWNNHGRNGPLVYGLLAGNRNQWCVDPSSCQIFYSSFCVLVIVSLITQYLVHSGSQLAMPPKPFNPMKFRHPSEQNPIMSCEGGVPPTANADEIQDEEEVDSGNCITKCLGKHGDDNTWASNLSTPTSTWFFLTLVVVLSCAATYAFSFFVNWSEGTNTNFFVALLYILTNAFCLWSIIEFFLTTLWFHVIRLIFGMPLLPRQDFSSGLPRTARTILSYCLLSKQKECSEEAFKTAVDTHLANLDPNMRITTAVVSVSSALSIVKCEMDCRDDGRRRIRQVLEKERMALAQCFPNGFVPDEDETMRQKRRAAVKKVLKSMQPEGQDRTDFWLQLLENAAESMRDVQEVLKARIEEAATHFVYLHRNCKVLKKPGQYQDLMVLGSTGSNRAYTYLQEDYGDIGRKFGSECFGFEGNVVDNSKEMAEEGSAGRNLRFEEAVDDLCERGREDILLVSGFGVDPHDRYMYTMVLDSDTVCPAKSIRKLVETAEHPANKAFGIINANLANDYGADSKCTWHMWRNALMEVSTVNLQRGQFWIFNRVGFYGKGLIRNDLYIPRLIGKPGSVVEALPIDILSHDTVEAKLLQPGIAIDVTLYEDVARNPISGMSQSTRWMLGEVRNGCYHTDGTYTALVQFLTQAYSLATKWEFKKPTFVRWREVPCAASAEYLSHTGFRLFHAGPGILLINLFTSLLATRGWGLTLVILPIVGFSAFLFTVLALFIIPKGFLILDKLPSLNLGRYCLCTKKASKIGDGTFNSFKRCVSDENASIDLVFHDADTASTSTSEEQEAEVDVTAPYSLKSTDSLESLNLNRCSILARQLVLALIEIVLSLLLFSPELVLGVIRLVRGIWAQATGSASWQPQDEVEKEVEQNLSLCFVFKKTWVVFACGVAYVAYVCSISLIHDALVWLIVLPWCLYPFSTYVMCMQVPDQAKRFWIWKW
eukprot:CAMPEP_0197624120 /NCGR_PEP_ID=MMETSP1338-20131121/3896_1 /TAXON_ID=43686 ORGANISM="Pelagodinium beii, Strain RCC1491" /NCGR_SAMPLE_ID=MMETSP1338 /ASSEMBLY_ACC=CAM_ASM_000754 /LENGTH=1112 /DNA_ID=CAMNT_0043194219 /DNA_START=135 /DNA_END=3470 /DNA_ORIENTATION=+